MKITNLLHFIQRKATEKNTLILLLFTMVVYITMLTYTIPRVSAFASGLPLFGLLPTGYSYGHAVESLTLLGQEGRSLYLNTQLPLDFIYPEVAAFSYSFLLAWIFKTTLK